MNSFIRRLIALIAIYLLVCARPAVAQPTYFWNYSGTNPTLAGSWSPGGGPPTAADTAVISTFDAPVYNLPNFGANAAYGQLVLIGPRPLANVPFIGNGNTLTLGTGGVMTGPVLSYRGDFASMIQLDNLRINIANGTSTAAGTFAQYVGAFDLTGNSARFELLTGSQLRLVNAAGTANYNLTISGGAQLLIRDGALVTNGLGVNAATQGAIRFHGGGTLNVQGTNGADTIFNVNQISAVSGHSSVGVFAGTSGTTPTVQLNVGNTNLQRGIDRYTRDSTGTVIGLGSGTVEFNFNSVIPGLGTSTGSLFFANGAVGATVPSQNGVITEGSSLNTNSPYVILTGFHPTLSGTAGRFATYNSATGAVTAQLGTTRDENTLTSAAPNENVLYRPTSTSANATLANSISPQTIVFEPRTSAQFVNLGGNTLTTPGIIVERLFSGTGTASFAIDNGTLAGPGAALRNIFVTSNLNLNVGATFGTGGGIVKAGAGQLILTGNTPQMNFGGDIILNQGALIARIDGPNANLGTNNVLALRGGVLEVDANGGTSTFSRNLGTGLGQVNWVFGTNFGDRGGGGFAVSNGALNINIGGGQNLVWHGTSGGNEFFLRSGQTLRLGSGRSNGIITLQNNLALDDGSAGLPVEARLITTEARSNISLNQFPEDPSVRSRITGIITGSAATRLMKGGPSALELTAANTYAGGTVVDLGHLQVNNTSGSGTGTGPVIVTRGILLGNGTIAPSAGNGVTIAAGGYSTAGIFVADSEFGTPGNLKVGAAGVNNPFTTQPGGLLAFRLNGATFNPAGGSTSYGRLTVMGTGAITLQGGHLNVGLDGGFTPTAPPASSDVFGVIDNQTSNPITGLMNYWDTIANPSFPPAVLIPDGGIVPVAFENGAPAGTMQVSYFGDITGTGVSITGGNDLVLYNFQPVPEPASVLAVGAAALAGFGFLRRKRWTASAPA
jgi:fibronectin-binding autotransporter adhesin